MAYESVNCIEANARIVGKVLLCFSGERQENFEPAGEGKEFICNVRKIVFLVIWG